MSRYRETKPTNPLITQKRTVKELGHSASTKKLSRTDVSKGRPLKLVQTKDTTLNPKILKRLRASLRQLELFIGEGMKS